MFKQQGRREGNLRERLVAAEDARLECRRQILKYVEQYFPSSFSRLELPRNGRILLTRTLRARWGSRPGRLGKQGSVKLPSRGQPWKLMKKEDMTRQAPESPQSALKTKELVTVKYRTVLPGPETLLAREARNLTLTRDALLTI